MPIKIAINGFGRIGRCFLKLALEKPDIEIVAINDLTDDETLAYLLKYDSVYGRYEKNVKAISEGQSNYLEVDGKKILSLTEKEIEKLPWGDLGVDVVIESTGVFTDYEKAGAHLKAGAKRVIITAPAKGSGGQQVLIGVNDEDFKDGLSAITSNASCTTNAIAPVVAILSEKLGIKKAILNTVHAYTATQGIVDRPDTKDLRRGRAAAVNLGPSSTGAAIATGDALPALKGKFDGLAIRVPVVCGSIADVTFVASKITSVEEINNILKEAEKEPRWKGIVKTSDEELVSTDIIKDPYPAIVDLKSTKIVDGDLVKVLIWYDNEWGYTVSLLEHVIRVGHLMTINS
ncbi:MAG: type I glyceraldehyde-3-phosphate dehydrogenase [Candidatus Paceibacterota bacterium]|jgi:glyceraldehyde 3-phosphate dehydrogenase